MALLVPFSGVSAPLTGSTLRQIWAVLTKRQAMAHLMWQHGEEALAKALVACKLFKALSCEAAEDNLETEFFEDLKRHAAEFENLGESRKMKPLHCFLFAD